MDDLLAPRAVSLPRFWVADGEGRRWAARRRLSFQRHLLASAPFAEGADARAEKPRDAGESGREEDHESHVDAGHEPAGGEAAKRGPSLHDRPEDRERPSSHVLGEDPQPERLRP